MSVVALTSSRTSPGATTLAAGLAIAWSHLVERSLLIEADPAGGVLALRFDLAPAPSLTSFGSDIRNGFEQEALWTNTQDLRGVHCIPGPVDPVLARSWIDRVTPALIEELPRLGAPAVIDLGWVDEDGASAKLANAADTTLVVTRPHIGEIQGLLFQVRRLEKLNANVAIVCIGDGPNDPAEVARIAGVPLAAVIPDDPKMAAALTGAKFSPSKFKRSLLWRTISGLGTSLLDEPLLATRSTPVAASPAVEEYNGFSDLRGTLDESAPAALASNEPLPPAPVELQRPQTQAPVSALTVPETTLSETAGTPPAPAAQHVGPHPIVAAAVPQLATPSVAKPSPASIARALASAAAMAQVLADAPDISPAATSAAATSLAAGPDQPSPVAPNRDSPTIIAIAPVPAAPTVAVPGPLHEPINDPGLFEDTRRMSEQAQIATLTLPSGERRVIAPGAAVTVGRHSGCDIVLNDSQVSRRHGWLVHTADGWHYSDLGSRNGTEINGQPCTNVVLGDRDVLTIGRTPITFDTTSQREMECA